MPLNMYLVLVYPWIVFCNGTMVVDVDVDIDDDIVESRAVL